MPELPEVEVLVRALRPLVVGRRIETVTIRRAKLVASPSAVAFRRRLQGRRVAALGRRGKTISAELDDGGHWLVHLRMTGWLRHYAAPRPAPDGHVLALFGLDRGQLQFRDPRRFGRMWWTDAPAEVLGPLGPEPLERGFTAAGLRAALGRRTVAVKQALLDPRVVAGVGNIYASEACFRARIDPRVPARRIGPRRAARLHAALREVLRRAIRRGATVTGAAGDEFLVYGRAGEPCVACGRAIRRIILGQRSTFLCPRCQPRST